jgi:hypothetical protein
MLGRTLGGRHSETGVGMNAGNRTNSFFSKDSMQVSRSPDLLSSHIQRHSNAYRPLRNCFLFLQ